MMFLRRSGRLLVQQKNLFNFCSTGVLKNVEDSALEQQKQQSEIPIHLQPYDASKYEVPSTKLKYSTGYALLDVEPMPRAKIMKLCYNILDKVKETPEESMYRIYTEEKIKYVMKLTDEIEDIRKLEEELGHDSVEVFIQSLAKELDLVDYMKDSKPWEARDEDLEPFQLGKIKREEWKHQPNERPERTQQKFIE